MIKNEYLKRMLKEDNWDECFQYNFVKPSENIKINKYHKISICTTCMGRLHDIKQTYIKNIEDTIIVDKYKDFVPVEFVLLNYNDKNGLDEWVKENLIKYIELGILNYYYTEEPMHYSMTHSRNIVFKLAQGSIVTNVDGDHFINKGFATKLNELANEFYERVVFVKSKQRNRGRLGFFKKEFIDLLGGYDEDLKEYGFDDKDLLFRANKLGFVNARFGGEYMTLVSDHKRHFLDNYSNKDWRYNEKKNTILSLFNIMVGKLKANEGRHWGKAKLIKNFKEEIEI